MRGPVLRWQGSIVALLFACAQLADVARNREDWVGLAFGPENRTYRDVPPSGRARHGVDLADETARFASSRRLDGGARLDMTLLLPEVGPGAAGDGVEVTHLHHALAALARDGQPCVELEHLNAVGRTGEDAGEKGLALGRRHKILLALTPQDLGLEQRGAQRDHQTHQR